MMLASFEHLEPRSLSETCAALAEHPGAEILAGGTDLLIRMRQRVATPPVVVNVKKVEELAGIRTIGGELRIGAAVTLGDLHRSEEVRKRAPVLAEAALAVGAAQLQNMGTLGGNLCLEPRCWYYQQNPDWRKARPACFKTGGSRCYMARGGKRCYAVYSGDTAPALLALGARVLLVGMAGERTLALEDFYVDDGTKHTVLKPGELVAGVLLPPKAATWRAAYLKFRRRGAVDFPVVGLAAGVAQDAGGVRDLSIAVTAVASGPLVVQGAQELAAGRQLTRELIEELAELAWKQARPVSHMEVSASYRKRLVRILAKDVLAKIA